MSFIKSDSLLSNIKNVSIRIDMKPNDGSNFFNSIMCKQDDKQRSIKLQSLFDYDGSKPNHQGNSLIDKLINPKQTPNPQAYHYNWLVCKNSGGMSEEEDNSDNQIQEKNVKVEKEQSKRQVQLAEQKTELKKCEKCEKKLIQPVQFEKESSTSANPKKLKNQTKNIPKNYGKAIICFIETYPEKSANIAKKCGVDYNELLEDLKKKKKCINTIADLRNLWSDYKHARCMRMITYVFLRKHALSYIFDSRICTYGSHIKYRQRLMEAVGNPRHFKHIKDY